MSKIQADAAQPVWVDGQAIRTDEKALSSEVAQGTQPPAGQQITAGDVQQSVATAVGSHIIQNVYIGVPLSPETEQRTQQRMPLDDVAVQQKRTVDPSLTTPNNTRSVDTQDDVLKTDLLEMPHVPSLFGREHELSLLQTWLLHDNCRLCSIVGVGGVGKTSLAARFISSLLAPDNSWVSPKHQPINNQPFTKIIWRSLLNAPLISDTLQQIIGFLADEQQPKMPTQLDGQLRLLIHLLQQERALLILDNVESIMQVHQGVQGYRAGYEGYGQLIQRVSESHHHSCLLFTSRECPQRFTRLVRERSNIHLLQLEGLPDEAAQQVLTQQGLNSDQTQNAPLIRSYAGHPLALKLVAETIEEFYFGDVDAFLAEDTLIFGDIRQVLDQQFARLSDLEQALVTWLAIAREPLSIQQLTGHLLEAVTQRVTQRDCLDVLRTLQQRSLLERHHQGFTLQNVIMEYVTDGLIDQLYTELTEDTLETLNRYALLHMQAAGHVRQSQRRLLLQPLITRLISTMGNAEFERRLLVYPQRLRDRMPTGYAAGNILNMAHLMDLDLSGQDFSTLSIWQADLQRLTLQDINFSHAHFKHIALFHAFGPISAVDISTNDELVVFGTTDGEIRIVRRQDGQTLHQWQGHEARINTVSFSPDGQMIASTSNDHLLQLWRTDTGTNLATLAGHTGRVSSAHFSPNGQYLVSGSRDHTIRIWNLQGVGQSRGHEIHHVQFTDSAEVMAVRFSPDGQMIASSNNEYQTVLRYIDDEYIHHTLVASQTFNGVMQLRFSRDGKWLAGVGGTPIKVWDTTNSQYILTVGAANTEQVSIDFTPDSRTLYSGGQKGKLYQWDVTTGKLMHSWQGHDGMLQAIRLSHDGQTLVTGGMDHCVRLWHAPTRGLLQKWQGYSNRIWSICFHPTKYLLVCGSERGTIYVWDIHSDQPPIALVGHDNWVMTLCFHPTDPLLASGSNGIINLWDTWDIMHGGSQPIAQEQTQTTHRANRIRHIFDENPLHVRVVFFTHDGRYLLNGRRDGVIECHDLTTLNKESVQYKTVQAHDGAIWALHVCPDGRLMASSSSDQTIRLWDMTAHNEQQGEIGFLQTLRGHEGPVGTVCFSPTAPILASGSGDSTIRLWDVSEPANTEKNRAIKTLQGHASWVNSICFHPDGQRLASGSADHTVCLWDISSGEQLMSLEGHTDRVWSVCFTPNGQHLASGSADGTIKLWDVSSGLCVKTLRPDRPYERSNFVGAIGITDVQMSTLGLLGATVDEA
ncbi:MAG: WD40 repeat domain-containing protein [Chloroflexota bacterium]